MISPGKTDILQYYGARLWGADIAYVVQPTPGGLCDALFRAAPLIHEDEAVLIGLPDTIWTPEDAMARLQDNTLSFLTFPVEHPELFDAVRTGADGSVIEIQVKKQGADSHWIWGAVKMPGRVFHQLYALWCRANRRDEYLGTLVNAWLAEGGEAVSVPIGEEYVDTGTLHGYRAAIRLLERDRQDGTMLKAADAAQETSGAAG